jgi:hypothetical protein
LSTLVAPSSLSPDPTDRRKTAGQTPPDLIVQYVASTFILVLNWWVETSSPLPPKEVDVLFRALILPSLASTLDRK